MSDIPKRLFELSQRIDDAEERIARVRAHITRLAEQHHDTSQARELLGVMLGNLQQLYRKRCNLLWIVGNCSDLGELGSSILSASLPMIDAHSPPVPPSGEAIRAPFPQGALFI